ncbi:MAG: MFS transporter, partial [Nanoarchaeota archaeon]|nr:MFS transporter [Nanoarchaeota archaeon]
MNGNHEEHIFKYVLDKKELNELYVSIVLRTLAFSMIGIFVPLFLFKELSYSLNAVICFFIVYALSFMLFTPLGAWLVSKIGFKHTILTSKPIYILFFGLLYLLETNPKLFFIVPAVNGLADGLYWIAFHVDFSMFSQKNKRGSQVGRWYSFSLLAGLVGPMIGGIILTFSGFNILFVIVSILLMGSTVPLFFTKDVIRKYELSWNFLKAGSLRDLVSFTAVGAKGMVGMVFWPIFIFAILKMYVTMGSLFTLLGVISLIVTFMVSKFTDVFNKRKIIKWFSILQGLIWIVKIFVKTKLELVGVAIFSNVTGIGADLPYTALTYNKARGRIDYLVFREFGLTIGRVLVLVLVLLSGSLVSSFLYAALASLGYILL